MGFTAIQAKNAKGIFFAFSPGLLVPQLPLEIQVLLTAKFRTLAMDSVSLASGIMFPADQDYCGRAREIIGKSRARKGGLK
jgi:hypothetical protein